MMEDRNPMEAPHRSKKGFVIVLLLLLLVGGYFFAQWIIGGREAFRGAAPEQPPVPLIAPVAQPPIRKYTEIAQYTEGKPLPAAPQPGTFLSPFKSDEHVRGDLQTEVTVVEYAALTSMYTQIIHSALQQLLETNRAKMHWVFRHYPATDNENDYRAGMAAECVAEQLGNDAFWSYLDLLMKEFGSSLPLDVLLTKGEAVGADTARLRTCIEQRELYDDVILDKRDAQIDSGIYVAPTFVFFNRRTYTMRIVEGINTVEYLQAVLDEVGGT